MNDIFSPRIVRFDATWRCNLNCKHCQTGMFRGPDHPEDLTTGEVHDLFNNLGDAGTTGIGLLGGEPMLRHDLYELLRHLRKLEIRPTLNTNGVLITEQAAYTLMTDCQADVSVSLDGATQETHEFIRGRGTWQRTMRGLQHLLAVSRRGTSVGMSVVLYKKNVHQAIDFLRLADDLGVDELTVAAVHRVGNAIRNWDELSLSAPELWDTALALADHLNSYTGRVDIRVNFFTPIFVDYVNEKLGYRLRRPALMDKAGIEECYIQSDGRVFPSQKCSEIVPDVLIGAAGEMAVKFRNNSVRDHRFIDIWHGADFSKYRDLMLSKRHMAAYATCRVCPRARTSCIPTAAAYLLDAAIPHPICETPLAELGMPLTLPVA